MPLYEFECEDCGYCFEMLLPLSSDSVQECPECGFMAERIVSAFSFKVGSTVEQKRRNEISLRQMDMKFNLKERYGVEEVVPLATSEGPASFESVYKDVVSRGSMVKDQMQETAGRNEEKSRKKQKRWLEDAWSRRSQRVKEVRVRQEQEKAAEFKKKSISLKTTS